VFFIIVIMVEDGHISGKPLPDLFGEPVPPAMPMTIVSIPERPLSCFVKLYHTPLKKDSPSPLQISKFPPCAPEGREV
jgi:hypothetical protein